MGNLYNCAGPTMGHLQHLKKKDKCLTNARGGGGGGGMHAVGID